MKLQWKQDSNATEAAAYYAGVEFSIRKNDKGKFNIAIIHKGQSRPEHDNDFDSMDDAMARVEKKWLPQYRLMSGDNIQRTIAWGSKVTGEVTYKKQRSQLAVVVEEIKEFFQAIQIDSPLAEQVIENLGKMSEEIGLGNMTAKILTEPDKLDYVDALDAMVDVPVTMTVLAGQLGMDYYSAFSEVNDSNFSKFKDGEPLFNERGKVIKYTPSYFKANLIPFIGDGWYAKRQ